MNACITNSSEVLGHGLGPFSHCYAKRTHFIFSCLSYVAFVFDLGKQNTSMRTSVVYAILNSTLSWNSFLCVSSPIPSKRR